MKTLQELKEARLIELAENAKEWKIKTTSAYNNWFKLVIYRDLYLGSFPEYIRTCNRLQWGWAKVAAWARGQRPCKVWALFSGVATLILLISILIMTWAGLSLIAQIPALVMWIIAGFIFIISASAL